MQNREKLYITCMEFGLEPQEMELKMWENLESRIHKSGFYCYIFHKIFIYNFLEKPHVD